MPSTTYSRLNKKARGAALIEFAIILPLLLIIIAGVLELSLFLIQDNTLNKSVRESSRYLSRYIGKQGCRTSIAKTVVAENMNGLFKSGYADFDSSNGTYTAEIVCVDEFDDSDPLDPKKPDLAYGTIVGTPSGIADGACESYPAACPAGQHVHVQVTATYEAQMLLQGFMGFNFAPTLSATSIMRVQ